MANVDGAVSFSPAGEEDWVPATDNRPLITGDRVWVDAGARAELQIGTLAVRLGSQTSVVILNLDDRVAQFQLQQGVLNVRVRSLGPDEAIEVDTPVLAFSLRRPGVYRIDVDAATGATGVAVGSGEGDAYGETVAYTIGERQWYRFSDAALRDYQYDALPPPDAFDEWTQALDRREDNAIAARYVSPEVIGYSDLDQYGTWSAVEGYGNVWVPTAVASDWAPYSDGHWAWIEPWGWTWVDAAPWGFAPFHYGRWAYARDRWCWVPGPRRERAVYAPALVAFVGGDSFSVSVGAGGPARGIAWFPLAPGEVYRPGYHVSRNYFTRVNASNTNVTSVTITNVYNSPAAANATYRNRNQRGAVTAMAAAQFAQSRPVVQIRGAGRTRHRQHRPCDGRCGDRAGPCERAGGWRACSGRQRSASGSAPSSGHSQASLGRANRTAAPHRRPSTRAKRRCPGIPAGPWTRRQYSPPVVSKFNVVSAVSEGGSAVGCGSGANGAGRTPGRTNTTPPGAGGGPAAMPKPGAASPVTPTPRPATRPDVASTPKTDGAPAPASPPARVAPSPSNASPQPSQPPRPADARGGPASPPGSPAPNSGASGAPAPARPATELRREPRPASPSPVPSSEVRREGPPPPTANRPPPPSAFRPQPAVVPPVPPQPVVRPAPAAATAPAQQRPPDPKATPAKSDAQKAKADDKREDPK